MDQDEIEARIMRPRPVALYELTPAQRELCDRVWKGRHALLSEMMYGSFEKTLCVMVSEEMWRTVIHPATNSCSPISREYVPSGVDFKIFGMPIRSSRDLKDNEVCFRAEVSI